MAPKNSKSTTQSHGITLSGDIVLERFGVNEDSNRAMKAAIKEGVMQGGGWREDLLESVNEVTKIGKISDHPIHAMRINNHLIYQLPQSKLDKTCKVAKSMLGVYHAGSTN